MNSDPLLFRGLCWWARHGCMEWSRRSALRQISRRYDGRGGQVETADGVRMTYRIGDPVDTSLAVQRTFEPFFTTLVKQLAGEHRTFIDVGCNIGYFSCVWGRHAKDRKNTSIFAIDANPAMSERCRENLLLNDVVGTVVNIGVGTAPGQLTLVMEANRPSQASFGNIPGPGAQTIPVRVDRISTILREQNIHEPTVVKIDIEGFEPAFFSGLDADHLAGIQHLIFEYAPTHLAKCGFTPADIWAHAWWDQFELSMIDEQRCAIIAIDREQVPDDAGMIYARRKTCVS